MNALESGGSSDDQLYVGLEEPGSRVNPLAIFSVIAEETANLYRSRFVIQCIVITNLNARYHGSFLGFLWTFLHPMMLLTVQTAAFSQIFRLQWREYAYFLFTGLVPWQFFMASIEAGSRTLYANEGLIRKVSVPKIVFPLCEVITNFVNLAFAMTAMTLLFALVGMGWYVHLPTLAGTLGLFVLFTFGLSLIVMTISTYFRDFTHILGVLLLALYFATPIMYPSSLIPNKTFLVWNPLAYFIELFHAAFPASARSSAMFAAPVDGQTWLVAAAIALGTALLGLIIYKSREHDYIFQL